MWYLVLSERTQEMEDIEANHEDHLQWLLSKHREGRILFSGPTTDRTRGIYVLLAENREQAETLASKDPHHLKNLRKPTIFEWDVRRAFRLNQATIEQITSMASQG